MQKTKIEWVDSTWNPVTGCFHECEYCYARRMAERFGGKQKYANIYEEDEPIRGKDGKIQTFPHSFSPTLHKNRLSTPKEWKQGRTIFVCSMADLFGEWVPDEWIKSVFDVCDKAPQHTYLFLTKNPERYKTLADRYMLPQKDNMWYGTSITKQTDRIVELGFEYNTFLSVEPLLEFLDIGSSTITTIDWVIIGAETGVRRNGEMRVTPEPFWIEGVVEAANHAGIPVFMKDSLLPFVGEDAMRREYPENLHR